MVLLVLLVLMYIYFVTECKSDWKIAKSCDRLMTQLGPVLPHPTTPRSPH